MSIPHSCPNHLFDSLINKEDDPVDHAAEELGSFLLNDPSLKVASSSLRLLPFCGSASPEELSLIISSEATVLFERDGRGFGPLAVASIAGRLDVLDLLLTFEETRKEFREGVHYHLLLAPILFGNLEVVKRLIDAGYPWFLPKSKTWTPIDFAARFQQLECLQYFYRTGIPLHIDTCNYLSIAFAFGSTDFCKSVFMEHYEVLRGNMDILAVIMRVAIVARNYDLFWWLLTSAETDFLTDRKRSHLYLVLLSSTGTTHMVPLFYYLCAAGELKILERLFESKEIFPDVWSDFGALPDYAVQFTSEGTRFIDIFKFLLSRGLSVTQLNETLVGRAWLMAASTGDIDLLSSLYDAETDDLRKQKLLYHAGNELVKVTPTYSISAGLKFLLAKSDMLSFDSVCIAIQRPNMEDALIGFQHITPPAMKELLDANLESILQALIAAKHLHLIKRLASIHPKVTHLDTEARTRLLGTVLAMDDWQLFEAVLQLSELDISLRSNYTEQLNPYLVKSIFLGHPRFVSLLQEMGVLEHVMSIFRSTHDPMLSAIAVNNLDLIKWIRRNKFYGIKSVNDRSVREEEDSKYYIDWVVLALSSNLEILMYVLDFKHLDLVDEASRDVLGLTVLHRAAMDNKVESFALLLQRCPDLLNATGPSEYTPLIVAASKANFEAFKILLRAGADISWTDESSHDAITHLINSTQGNCKSFLESDCKDLLSPQAYRPDHIRAAASQSHPGALEFLLRRIFPHFANPSPHRTKIRHNINHIHFLHIQAVKNGHWNTLLFLATMFPLPDHRPVNFLLDFRTRLMPADYWRQFYDLGLVGCHLNMDCITFGERLKESRKPDLGGDDWNTPSVSNISYHLHDPLLKACSDGDLTLVKRMYNYGADLFNPRGDEDGLTPLLAACESRHSDARELIAWLLAKGCNPFQTDFNGFGIQHYAARRPYLPELLALLD